MLPNRVKFFLYTKDNPEDYVEIDPAHLDQLKNPNAKIVFIIHGWMSSREAEWYEPLTNAFLEKDEEYYVVQVDWSIPANGFYALASWSTKDVGTLLTILTIIYKSYKSVLGNLIAKFIVVLNEDHSFPLSNFLIVGHSLGAQVAGFVGKKVLLLTQYKLPRIVGLDPAGPLFNTRPKFERLNKYDADVVQVIHTDDDTFGFKHNVHGLDFYPNGGKFQPRRHSKALLFSLMRQITWSHEAGPRYFASAIANPDAFMATKARSWENYLKGKCDDEEKISMGDMESYGEGKYYLEITEE